MFLLILTKERSILIKTLSKNVKNLLKVIKKLSGNKTFLVTQKVLLGIVFKTRKTLYVFFFFSVKYHYEQSL